MNYSHARSQHLDPVSGALRRRIAARRQRAVWTAPASAKRGVVYWVLAWTLSTAAVGGLALLWEEAHPPGLSHAVLATDQVPVYDAVRCNQVAETWNAAERAAEQYRLTRLWEYRADAERLRQVARADGRLYCNGDPLDR